MLTGNFSKDLLPGVQKFFGLAYDQWETMYDKIFDVEKTKERYQEDVIVAGLGLAQVKPEGAAINYDSGQQGATQRYEQVVYAKGFQISREAMDDGHALKLAKDYAENTKLTMLQTREIVHANVLNNGFSSSYTGMIDGLCLFNTAHTTIAGGTYKNRPSVDADLSEAALEQATIDINALIDERGIKIFAMPKMLIVPTNLRFTAERLLKSVLRPGVMDNDINALKMLDIFSDPVLVSPFLTAAQAYFIKTSVPKGLRSFEKDALEITDDESFDTDTAKYKARMRFTQGWSDPRGMYGVNGP